jgi:hypothetical protein
MTLVVVHMPTRQHSPRERERERENWNYYSAQNYQKKRKDLFKQISSTCTRSSNPDIPKNFANSILPYFTASSSAPTYTSGRGVQTIKKPVD